MKKNCKTCKADFVVNNNSRRRVYCSKECNPRLAPIPLATCKGCGETFQPKDKRYAECCDRKCGALYNKRRRAAGEITTAARYTPQQSAVARCVKAVKRVQAIWKARLRPCLLCRTPHLAKSNTGKGLCCDECQTSRGSTFQWTNVCSPICVDCQKPREYGENTRSGKRCSECHGPYEIMIKRSQNRAGKARRRAKKKGAPRIEGGITLRKIAARDNDECHICGDAVQWNDSPQGNWYPSMDHVIPLAKGGCHTFDNIKLAHRWCNSIKCDGDHIDLRPTNEPVTTNAETT